MSKSASRAVMQGVQGIPVEISRISDAGKAVRQNIQVGKSKGFAAAPSQRNAAGMGSGIPLGQRAAVAPVAPVAAPERTEVSGGKPSDRYLLELRGTGPDGSAVTVSAEVAVPKGTRLEGLDAFTSGDPRQTRGR